jgi:GNAT superfamily N-acetyltransferase
MREGIGIVARYAGIADVPALGVLMIEFYREAGFALPRAVAERTFARLLAVPTQGQIWLLEADGRPAGFIVLTISFSMEYGGQRGLVDDFFVATEFRRQGLGSLALQVVKEECSRREISALLVEVGRDNESAIRICRRAGMADTDHMLMKLSMAQSMYDAWEAQ